MFDAVDDALLGGGDASDPSTLRFARLHWIVPASAALLHHKCEHEVRLFGQTVLRQFTFDQTPILEHLVAHLKTTGRVERDVGRLFVLDTCERVEDSDDEDDRTRRMPRCRAG